MTFRLVRAEPSDSMIEASRKAFDARKGHAGASAAMLAASEPPTDDEIDDLCRKMWGDSSWWNDANDPSPRYMKQDRTRMRAFIVALEGKQP